MNKKIKNRKIFILIILFISALFMLSFGNISNASVGMSSFTLKLTSERTADVAWKANGNTNKGTYKIKYQLNHDSSNSKTKNIWKLEPTGNSSAEELKNIYCIRAGLGFNATGGQVDGQTCEYTSAYELPTDYTNLQSVLKSSPANIFETSKLSDFNAMLWILDNMLLEDAKNTEVEEYLWKNAYSKLDEYEYSEDDVKLTTDRMRFDILSRADVEAIQQLAIWHFTNNDEDVYQDSKLSALYVNISDYKMNNDSQTSFNTNWTTMEEWANNRTILKGTDGTKRQAAANELYTYLITTATNATKGMNTIYNPSRTVTVYLGKGITTDQPVVTVKEAQKIKIKVEKEWKDENNQDGLRKECTFTLKGTYGVGNSKTVDIKEATKTLKLNSGNSVEWDNLDKTKEGYEIQYTVTENTVAGYKEAQISSVEPTENDYAYQFKVINEHTPETVNVKVKKTWQDGNNQDGKRTQCTFKLKAICEGNEISVTGVDNAEVTYDSVTNGTEWSHTWEGLPKYKAEGKLITYKVDEVAGPSEYTTNSSQVQTDNEIDVTIVNKYTPEKVNVELTKIWNDNNNQDGKREKLQFKLKATCGTEVVNLSEENAKIVEYTPNGGNTWTYSWNDLPKYQNGQQITYTVEEVNVPTGYTSSTTPIFNEEQKKYEIKITNEHTPETVNVKLTKTWNDGSNQDGKRKDIKFQLKAQCNGKPVTIAGNNANEVPYTYDSTDTWTHTWADLPKYQDGQKIIYTVEEIGVPVGYTNSSSSIESQDGKTYEINMTNNYTPEKVEVKVTKTWQDNNNQDGLRKACKFKLKATWDNKDMEIVGVEPLEVTYDSVQNEDTWTHSWKDLPKYKERKRNKI